MAPRWLRELEDGLELHLHVQPGAKRTEIVGPHADALKLRLAAPPVEGRANEALIAFLADAFGVPQRNVTIVRGGTSRRKVVRVASPSRRSDQGWATGAGER